MLKKSIILLVVTIGLIGCGGTSGGNNSENSGSDSGSGSDEDSGSDSGSGSDEDSGSDGGMSAGNGNCITVPSPTAGQKYKIRGKTLGANSGTVDVEISVKSFNNTSMETDTVSTGDITATGKKTETHSISNDFIEISKIITKDTTTITVQGLGAITTVTDLTLDFSPSMRHAFGKFCENQVWSSTYDITTTGAATASGVTTPIAATTTGHSTNYTVEKISISQTVTAGIFDTYQLKAVNGNSVNTTWFDTVTGIPVKSENLDNSGQLVSTQELISK